MKLVKVVSIIVLFIHIGIECSQILADTANQSSHHYECKTMVVYISHSFLVVLQDLFFNQGNA